MAPHFYQDDAIPPINSTAVAIEKDSRNSKAAVRWAIENLVVDTHFIILIHVRHKNYQSTSTSTSEANDAEGRSIFAPFRAYCARKSVQLKEVLIDDMDVSKSIIEYVGKHCITNVVAGASTRNALTRKFKGNDVPTNLVKSAPEFCSVYVISKGKLISARNSQRPALNTAAPPRENSPLRPPFFSHDHHESEHGTR